MEMMKKNMQSVKRSVERIMNHKNYNENIQAVLNKLNEEIDDYRLYERHLRSVYELMELGIRITVAAYN